MKAEKTARALQAQKTNHPLNFLKLTIAALVGLAISLVYEGHAISFVTPHSMPFICIPGAARNDSDYDYTNHRYVNAVYKAGGIPIQIPILPKVDTAVIRSQLGQCDAVLFQGGIDIDPVLYGEPADPLLGEHIIDLDKVHFEMYKICTEKKLPVLGICRGHQLINAAAGGTLYQDLSRFTPAADVERCIHRATTINGVEVAGGHNITIENGTILSQLFPSLSVHVNSFHHQSVAKIAPGFRVSAVSPDGIVEAIEKIDGQWIVGVQFHPEIMLTQGNVTLPLFQELVKQAKKLRIF